MKKLLTLIVIALLTGPLVASAARTDGVWDNFGTYMKTVMPGGLDVLINGVNKYLNFNTVTGSSGYGLRDNGGTIEFKNSGGSWTGIGTGGGASTTLLIDNNTFSGSNIFTSTTSLSGGITGPNSFVVQQTSGNVGINTISPDSKLDIEQGDLRFTNVSAPSIVTTALGAAGVLTGTYSYRVSFVTANGETEPSNLAVQRAPVAQQIDLSNIPISTDPGVIGRRIYRNKNADGIYKAMYVVTTINDNTTTTYSDNIADASLGSINTMTQTTGGVIYAKTTPFIVGNTQITSVGIGALPSNSAPANSAFGYHALFNNTTGGFNNAFGNGTLAANTTANTNNAFGTNALSTVTVNGNNSAFGNNALQATTGSANTGIGSGAGLSNTSGTDNTAIGSTAMYRTLTGSNNTVVGSTAGQGVAGNSYSGNSLFGYGAGFGLTTGSTNVVLGYNSGYNLTTGANNILIGNTSYAADPAANGQLNIQNIIYGTGNTGTGATLSTGSIGIGTTSPAMKFHVAGTSLTDKIQTDIGLNFSAVANPSAAPIALLTTAGNVDAGQHYYFVTYYTALGTTRLSATSPTSVTTDGTHAQVQITLPVASDYRVVGRKIYRTPANVPNYSNAKLVATIADNTTTSYTDNIPDSSLTGVNLFYQENTTNKFFSLNGSQAGFLGVDSTFLGVNAGTAITSGGRNTFIGGQAGQNTTTGTQNVFVGGASGAGNTTGNNNIGIGQYAIQTNTGGGSNIAIGYSAGFNATGAANILIGDSAGKGSGSVTFNNSIGIGHNALSSLSTGGNNTVLGYQGGVGITTGANNILVGASVATAAQNQVTTGSNNISIGYNTAIASSTLSNQLDIGNLIYGTGLDGSGTTLSSGNVGIGTTTPSSKLAVFGTLGSGTALFNVATSTASNVFSDLFRIGASGLIHTGGTVPTVVLGTGAGTGPSATVAGTPNDINFNLTTGSAPAGSNATIGTFTMPAACTTATIPVVSDANANADALDITTSKVFASSTSATTFVLNSGSAGLSATTNYIWNIHIACY